MTYRAIVLLVILVCQLMLPSSLHAAAEQLKLFGRDTTQGMNLSLDESQWQWLRSRGVLRVGIFAPDSNPLSFTTEDGYYEGYTADYVGLLSQLLDIRIDILRFDSREEAVKALKGEQVDILGMSTGFDLIDPQLVLSSAYGNTQPVLTVAINARDEDLSAGLEGKRLAMSERFLPKSMVANVYPKASIQLYTSELNALSAVVFGLADVYLGDAITTSYLINKYYPTNAQVNGYSQVRYANLSFVLSPASETLRQIINQALDAVPAWKRREIARRWSAGAVNLPWHKAIDLTPREAQWLEAHPKLKIGVVEDYPPLSFFDSDRHYRGVLDEMLNKISTRTGLKFEVIPFEFADIGEMNKALQNGRLDLVSGFNRNGVHDTEVHFTRPYYSSPFVLLGKSGYNDIKNLDDLNGKTLGIRKGHTELGFITSHYPGIRIVEVAAAVDAMALIVDGELDATITTLMNANYQIRKSYPGQLKVIGSVGASFAQYSMGVKYSSIELYSILNKSLMAISPEEFDQVSDRWREQVTIDESTWHRHRTGIIQGFIAAAVLLLLALYWIFYLRISIRRRVIAEGRLNQQMEFMRVLIDGIPHPIYVGDRKGLLLICNNDYAQNVGLPQDELLGQPISLGVAGWDRGQGYEHDYSEVVEQGISFLEDCVIQLRNDRFVTVQHWFLPFRGHRGEIKGVIAGWIDIGERDRLVRQLQGAKDEAERANRAKTSFLATMSHEIRTPMNAVIGMLELALKRAEKGVLDRFSIEVASRSAQGLLGLIGDILDVVKIESGKLTLSPKRTNLRALVESVVQVFDGLARQKGLQLVLEFDARAKGDVLADPLHIKHILSNLLSNAIKFTAKGSVHLDLSVVPQRDSSRLNVRLVVKDTGVGISAEDQAALFAPFSQVGGDENSGQRGSGLGLLISRSLCNMMQGELVLTSSLGKGTTIEVMLSLPKLDPLPSEQVTEEKQSEGTPLRILVVDDYPANRILLSQQLSYLGHSVVEAENGEQGLRIWQAEQFDAVITDCNMPVMNGYELARYIRGHEQEEGATPCLIIGFTANAQEEERRRCIGAGMDDCLFKPTSLADLHGCLRLVQSSFAPSLLKGSAVFDSIDLGALNQLTDGDTALTRRLLTDLAVSNEEDSSRLVKLFGEQDREGLAELAHRIKGAAKIIRSEYMVHCCEGLEIACKSGSPGTLVEAVDKLQQAMESLAEILKQDLQGL